MTAAAHESHKAADRVAAASEAVHCVGWLPIEVRDVLQIEHAILEEDPLVARYGGTPWEPWSAQVAADRFLAELKHLLHKQESETAFQAVSDCTSN